MIKKYCYTWRGERLLFRREPIPRTGHTFLFGGSLRAMRTTQELRRNHKDTAKYTRGKRRNLPTLYDDIWVAPERNWKSQGRRVKQWDRPLKKNWRSKEDGEKASSFCVVLINKQKYNSVYNVKLGDRNNV